MSQACPERHGDIGAYIAGALDRDAEADVRWHLTMCSGCRAEYEDLLPVREWLGLLGWPAHPSRLAKPIGSRHA